MANESLDDISQRVFEAPYAHLSSWGQAHVAKIAGIFAAMDKPKVLAPHNTSLDNIGTTLVADNERLGRLLDQLQIENGELWQENAELRAELASLQGQV